MVKKGILRLSVKINICLNKAVSALLFIFEINHSIGAKKLIKKPAETHTRKKY